jgi:hypothetical protein
MHPPSYDGIHRTRISSTVSAVQRREFLADAEFTSHRFLYGPAVTTGR